MTHNEISVKINEYINKMPSLPVSVGKVLQICNKTNADPTDLNHVISLDPVLTGRLLKLINSAYYGLGTHVVSLVRAIIMLGINTVKNIALSSAVMATLHKNKTLAGLNMDGYWRHCLCVGVTAKLLAIRQGVDKYMTEEYFTAGLLHDIGKIPMNAVLSSEYSCVISEADKNKKSLIVAENDILGIDHCAAGVMIIKEWKLEGPVADVILYHHDPLAYSGENSNYINIIALANYFSSIYDIGFAGDRCNSKPEQEIWEATGINEDIFEELKENVRREIQKAEIFLKIHN